jgi:hypothetical protein
MNTTQKLADNEFETRVKAAIAAVKDDPQSLDKVNELLQVVGCNGRSWDDIEFRSICPPKEHQALVVEALLLGVRTYLNTPASTASRLQHALAGLYELDAWRPLVECRDTVHAAAHMLLVMGSYLGHRLSRGLDMLNDWLEPTTPFTHRDMPANFKKLQQAIVTEMFGEAWWLFNGPELGRSFDINQITEQKPAFRVGLFNAASEEPQVLPEMTHAN